MNEREVPYVSDFPKPGVTIPDMSAFLANDSRNLVAAVDWMADIGRQTLPKQADRVLALESWGYVFGAGLALRLGLPLTVARRRPDLLPGPSVSRNYGMSYSDQNWIGIQEAAVRPGDICLLVDDYLASGSTALAAIDLVRELDAQVVLALFVATDLKAGGLERIENGGTSVCVYEASVRAE